MLVSMWGENNYMLFKHVNSFGQWVDIVFTKDGICILVYVVIVDPTWADLLPQSCATQEFVAFDVA